jgi:ATP-dependent DNA helicase RecG
MLWGVRDEDHAVISTGFQPSAEGTQGQLLEFWLAQRLSPDVAFSFHEIVHPNGRIVLREIPAATTAPVEFDRTPSGDRGGQVQQRTDKAAQARSEGAAAHCDASSAFRWSCCAKAA